MGSELEENVDTLLAATDLERYRNREASRLSGGNQRKLALAIALMGMLLAYSTRGAISNTAMQEIRPWSSSTSSPPVSTPK